MYDKRSSQSIRILPMCMRVVPVCSGLGDLGDVNERVPVIPLCTTYLEVIGKRSPCRYGTLGNTGWAIHMRRAIHVEAMEM